MKYFIRIFFFFVYVQSSTLFLLDLSKFKDHKNSHNIFLIDTLVKEHVTLSIALKGDIHIFDTDDIIIEYRIC